MRVFAYNGYGQIIERRDGTAAGDTFSQGSNTTHENQHYVYVNGEQVAHFDEGGTLDVLTQVTAFDNTGAGTGGYVVQRGDTLRSIAQAVYGNAAYWYVIAQANAISSDSDLAIGQNLTLPQITTTSNTATTFKPYNPSDISGSTTPNLPTIAPPPVPPAHHCNVLAAIVVIAVIVVATVLTAGALAPAAAGAGASIFASGAAVLTGAAGLSAGTLATAFAAGVVGNLAGQAAGDALGTHSGISLGQAFVGGFTTAAAAGLGAVLQPASSAAAAQAGTAASSTTEAASAGNAFFTGAHELTFAGGAIEGAGAYAANVVGSHLVGQSSQFSWAGLVAATLAGGSVAALKVTPVGQQVGQSTGSFLGDVGAGVLRGEIASQVSRGLGDKRGTSTDAVLEDAFGNALGNAVVRSLTPPDVTETVNRSLTHEEAAIQFDLDAEAGLAASNDLDSLASQRLDQDFVEPDLALLVGQGGTTGTSSPLAGSTTGWSVGGLASSSTPTSMASSSGATGELSYLTSDTGQYDLHSSYPLARYLSQPQDAYGLPTGGSTNSTTPVFADYRSGNNNGDVTHVSLYDYRSESSGQALSDYQAVLLNDAFGNGRNEAFSSAALVDGDITVSGAPDGQLNGLDVSRYYTTYVTPNASASGDVALRLDIPDMAYQTTTDDLSQISLAKPRIVDTSSNLIDLRTQGSMSATPDNTRQIEYDLELTARTRGIFATGAFAIASQNNPGNIRALQQAIDGGGSLDDLLTAHVGLGTGGYANEPLGARAGSYEPISRAYSESPYSNEIVPQSGQVVSSVAPTAANAGVGTASAGRVSSRPAWLQRLDAGNAFNAARAPAYPYNEVYIDSPTGTGYTRLDSYNPNAGEIVSRKFTQLSAIQAKTAIGYINEIAAKYPVGATIANVPSSGPLAKRLLQGQYILEVPVQNNRVPQAVLDAANKAGVLIRDVNGTIY